MTVHESVNALAIAIGVDLAEVDAYDTPDKALEFLVERIESQRAAAIAHGDAESPPHDLVAECAARWGGDWAPGTVPYIAQCERLSLRVHRYRPDFYAVHHADALVSGHGPTLADACEDFVASVARWAVRAVQAAPQPAAGGG